MSRRDILGVGFDPISMGQALQMLEEFIHSGKPHLAVTANPEMVMKARRDLLLAEILQRADLVVADGIGVVWAASFWDRKFQSASPASSWPKRSWPAPERRGGGCSS